jgi:hypothetical protein
MYSPPDFQSNFASFITDDDTITIKEVVDLEDGKIWKKSHWKQMGV